MVSQENGTEFDRDGCIRASVSLLCQQLPSLQMANLYQIHNWHSHSHDSQK